MLTDESPPQAQILMMSGTFSAPSSVTVTIKPVKPPLAPPSGTVTASNVYQITASAGGRELQPNSQDPATIVLRGSGASAMLVLYFDSGSGWQALRTFNVGCGYSFEAVSPRLGYFALFQSGGSSTGSGGFPAAIVVAILGVL
ncbi:MAG TPA: hypothetical protein VGH93_08390, partial [Solirubrobacteraceae bacterium]